MEKDVVDDDLDLDVEDESPRGESKTDPEPETEPEAKADDVPDRADDEEPYGARVKKRIDKEVWKRKSAEEEAARLKAELSALRADVDHIKTRHSATEAQAAEGQWREKVADVQRKLKQAKEDGDIDAELKLMDEYVELRAKPAQAPGAQPVVPAATAIPAGTQTWLARNSWFQSGANPRAARLAAELDAELQAEGYSPHDPATYAELNRRLKSAMPKIAPLLGEVERPKAGPPTGANSATAESTVPAKKRTLTQVDLEEMQSFGLNPKSMEDRKAWLRAHQ